MLLVMEREPAAVAFAEPLNDFSLPASGASSLGEEISDLQWRARSASETAMVRWQFSILHEMAHGLHQEVQRVVAELPRLLAFRQRLRDVLRPKAKQKPEDCSEIIASIRRSAVPTIYVQEVLRQCSTSGGPNSFDLAIDLLAGFDAAVLEVFLGFLAKDRGRWLHAPVACHVNDDVCYILIRALARSKVPFQTKLDSIGECLTHGTSSIREGATHALRDVGGDAAKNLLKHAVAQDPDPLVRDSAQEALDDLGT